MPAAARIAPAQRAGAYRARVGTAA